MLNLFDDWQRGSIDLVRSQKIAGIKVPTVVINDDGFLPAEVDSPIKQYRKQTGEPLYFDQVQVPRFWQIKGDASGAQVYDLNTKRAEIRFFKNDNTRFVKQVEWLNAAGGSINMISMGSVLPRRFMPRVRQNSSSIMTRHKTW